MIASFDDFKQKQNELELSKKAILNAIDEYIKFNIEFNDDFLVNQSIYHQEYGHAYDFYNDSRKDTSLIINYSYGKTFRTDEVYFFKKDYDDLLKFMKNPEMYKIDFDAKKYNL